MAKLIKLEDGTLVEIEVSPGEAEHIAGGSRAKKVSATFDQILPVLTSVCRPINAAWKEISREMEIQQAEIELGLKFEGEGNLFVTKSKAGGNLTVKLIVKPKG